MALTRPACQSAALPWINLTGQRFTLMPKMMVAAWRDGATPIIDLADHLIASVVRCAGATTVTGGARAVEQINASVAYSAVKGANEVIPLCLEGDGCDNHITSEAKRPRKPRRNFRVLASVMFPCSACSWRPLHTPSRGLFPTGEIIIL